MLYSSLICLLISLTFFLLAIVSGSTVMLLFAVVFLINFTMFFLTAAPRVRV